MARAAGQQAGAGVLGEVVRAHDEAGEPRVDVVRRARDRLRPQDRERRLDHRPDPGALRGAEPAQAQAHRRERFGRRHLGHEDRIRRGGDGGRKIGLAPGRLERVDADHHFPLAVAARLHGRADLLARLRLRIGRDRVLEVEDQRVGGKRLGLLEGAGVGAGHVEHAAARADGSHGVFLTVRIGFSRGRT